MSLDKSKIIDIAIIGAGAAGLSAAVSAGFYSKIKNNKNLIAIFEAKNKIGTSILKTGNGRCNFSNYYIEENKGKLYNNKEFCNQVFESVDTVINKHHLFGNTEDMSAALQMFESLGLACYCDEDGKMFPYTNKATSVVDVFKYAVEDLKIEIFKNFKLKNIKKNQDNKTYCLEFENGKNINAKKIIFTIGHEKINNNLFNKNFISYKKVLGPIKSDIKFLKNLDGTKAHVKATICNNKNKPLSSEIGEILFRKYGVSGICIFNLSRFLENERQKIIIDFAPEDTLEDLIKLVKFRYQKLESMNNKKIAAEKLFAGMILPNIISNICSFSKSFSDNIHFKDINKICKALKSFELKVFGIGDDKQCQISRGGIKTSALSTKTLEYKDEKGIYFAGEVVDVDGPCGGFNLHWAWSSGILAGASAVKNLS